MFIKDILENPSLLRDGERVQGCSVCKVRLQETITGKRRIGDAYACSDCYYEQMGQEVENFPVARRAVEDVEQVLAGRASAKAEQAPLEPTISINETASRIISYMLDRGLCAPSSELNFTVRQELTELARRLGVADGAEACLNRARPR